MCIHPFSGTGLVLLAMASEKNRGKFTRNFCRCL